MKTFLVKDLMVPISEYATVSKGATLSEAVLALEKVQEEFSHNKYSHRAVLVLDEDKRVVGKLSQLDFLHAIEIRDEETESIKDIAKFGFSSKAIARQQEQYRLTVPVSKDIYTRAAKLKVEAFMQRPSEGEYVEENNSFEAAVHQLITGSHLSLLVTRGNDIVGVLRLADIFAAAFHTMKQYESTQ